MACSFVPKRYSAKYCSFHDENCKRNEAEIRCVIRRSFLFLRRTWHWRPYVAKNFRRFYKLFIQLSILISLNIFKMFMYLRNYNVLGIQLWVIMTSPPKGTELTATAWLNLSIANFQIDGLIPIFFTQSVIKTFLR